MISLKPIEIVGGGLAGLSLGLALRRVNVPVTLFETGSYPRHRVCGEFITGLDSSTITRLDLAPFLEDARRHHEVAWFISNRATQIQRLPAPALGVSRYRLDQRLANAFAAAGGDLRTQTRITETTMPPGRIIASGRRRENTSWLGLKIHVHELELHRDLELHLGDQCYLGLTRVEEDRVNLCGLFRRRKLTATNAELLLAYLHAAGLTTLAGRLANARFDRTSFSAVAAVGFDRHIKHSTQPRLGDACAMIPPFTGNGMAMAFQSASIALDPVLAYARGEIDWSQATDAMQAAFRRCFRLRLASAHWLHPFLLNPAGQSWLGRLGRRRLLPLNTLYSVLH